MRITTAIGAALGVGLAMAGSSSGCALIAGVRDDAIPYPVDGGAGGSSASSSAGGAPVCVPSTTIACYSGKDGEQGTGQCKAGTKTCNADGTAYEACLGEVLPGTESCKTAGDEDCDGLACSDCVWSFLAGDVNGQTPTDMAIDSSGNIVIVGYFTGTLKLQNKAKGSSVTLNSAGEFNYFAAKFDTNGDVLWAKGFGGVGGSGLSLATAVDSNGNIGIAGQLSTTTNFGGKPLTVLGLQDIFVVKLDSTGNHVWSKNFGSQFTLAEATALAFDPTGNLVVGAKANNDITIGSKSFTGSGYYDAIIMMMTATTGDIAWVYQYKEGGSQTNGHQSITHLTTDTSGIIYAGGTFSGGICLTGAASACANTVGGGKDTDLFVAKIDNTGNVGWARIIGTPKDDTATDVTVDSSGNVIITGAIGASFNFGGGLQSVTGPGQRAFLAKYTNIGTYLSARIFDSTGGTAPSSIGVGLATDAADNIYLAGNMVENLNLGGDLLINGGPGSTSTDIFLGKFDANLAPLWSKSFGDAKYQHAAALRYDSSGKRLVLAGQVAGSVNFGTGALPGMSPTYSDLALAKFQP
jgi:hypothetical protein